MASCAAFTVQNANRAMAAAVTGSETSKSGHPGVRFIP